jgi:hypothetical protein
MPFFMRCLREKLVELNFSPTNQPTATEKANLLSKDFKFTIVSMTHREYNYEIPNLFLAAQVIGSQSIGLMGNAEQATITNLNFSTANHIVVTVENTGKTQVTITTAYVNARTTTSTPVLPQNISVDGRLDLDLGCSWISGIQYEVKLTTSKGNNLVLSTFCP